MSVNLDAFFHFFWPTQKTTVPSVIPIAPVEDTVNEPVLVPASYTPDLVKNTGHIAGLSAALSAVASVNQSVWIPAMEPFMISSGIVTVDRVAAFLGQMIAEIGSDFSELRENMYYSTPQRIYSVFTSHFSSVNEAASYARNPEKLANRVYAGILGNGNESSGDGFKFRGAGGFQLTGRFEHGGFATATKTDINEVGDYAATPTGAIHTACWYWTKNDCSTFADTWDLQGLTKRVNGGAMMGLDQRVKIAEAARSAMTKISA